MYLAVANLFLILAGGALLAIFEPEVVKGDFVTGIWLAVVTATTVGYGDITPVTPAGRLVAVVLMLGGVGLVSTLAAAIAAYFVGQDTHAQLDRLTGQMERLEKLLEESRKDAATKGR